MATTIAFECAASQESINAFIAALSRYQRETQRDMRAALRSATVDLIKSFRARTAKSKKFVELAEVTKSDEKPKWISRGHAGRPLRRMAIARYGGGRMYFDHRYVYGGEMVQGRRGGLRLKKYTPAHMRREARRVYGGIRNWGLAKKSWGWFLKSIFRKAAQDENPKALIRDDMVEGGITEYRKPLPDGTIDVLAPLQCTIIIVNRLDYIRKAMPSGVFEIALSKAAHLINYKIDHGLKTRRFG